DRLSGCRPPWFARDLPGPGLLAGSLDGNVIMGPLHCQSGFRCDLGVAAGSQPAATSHSPSAIRKVVDHPAHPLAPRLGLGRRRSAAPLLKVLNRVGGDPILRAAREVGGEVDADQLAAPQKRMDFVRTDFPPATKVRDAVALLQGSVTRHRSPPR